MGIISFILFLLIAATCAAIAEYFVPGRAPGGFLATAIIGVLGAWVGSSLMGHLGPDLAGVSIIPAIIGAAVVVFIIGLIKGRGLARR
ncbi:MAG TPA: GlsB/YeaQ/YmgE family stress response membrane protein [Oculatellaceae cyanobacterium]